MKKLIICEKNSLARGVKHGIESMSNETMRSVVYYKGKDALSTLIYYESTNYIVTAVVGHIFELQSIADYKGVEKISWKDVSLPYHPDNFDFKRKIKKEFKKRFKMINELINRNDVDGIFNCGDNDREGEILIREVINETAIDKPVYRLALAEVTDNSVRLGLSDMRSDKEFNNIANEGFARQYADWLYGINLTTYATVKMENGIYSVGRVISAIVRAIYERDMSIRNFHSRKYISGLSKEKTNGEIIELLDKEKFYAEENNQFSEETKKSYNDYFNNLNRTTFKVIDKSSKEKKVKRPKLFSQGKLQNLMNEKYNYSPKDTLNNVQQLYLDGYVTYPRTPSEYMATGEIGKAEKIIDSINDKWNANLSIRKTKDVFDDSKVESHSAITPTDKLPDVDTLPLELKNTYLEILSRFKAVFYSEEYIIQETNIIVSNGNKEFTLKGNTVLQKGWSIFSKEAKEKLLPNLEINDIVNVRFEPVIKETVPPKHYTVTTLNNFMINPFRKDSSDNDDELYRNIHAGVEIGTEATRPDIIERARKYQLISLKGSTYTITDKGIEYIHVLERLKIDISTEKSVYLNTLIKSVYRNEMTIEDCCKTVFSEIKNIIIDDISVDDMKEPKKIEFTGELCPECGSKMVWKKGRFGKFEACSNYPDCKYVKPVEKKVNYSGDVCPQCGSKMVWKKGRFRKFESCSNYPDCKYIKSVEKKINYSGDVCPQCGSKMVWKKGRFGKFEACSNYPSCKYIKKQTR